uniref:ShKT domain-containing protein n=1 Tax=Steinernema glaseri TaxID=37863 RepID=A0A1I7ZN51_9BILA
MLRVTILLVFFIVNTGAQEIPCDPEGSWSDWDPWGECSSPTISPEYTVQVRARVCQKTPVGCVVTTTVNCTGSYIETRPCHSQDSIARKKRQASPAVPSMVTSYLPSPTAPPYRPKYTLPPGLATMNFPRYTMPHLGQLVSSAQLFFGTKAPNWGSLPPLMGPMPVRPQYGFASYTPAMGWFTGKPLGPMLGPLSPFGFTPPPGFTMPPFLANISVMLPLKQPIQQADLVVVAQRAASSPPPAMPIPPPVGALPTGPPLPIPAGVSPRPVPFAPVMGPTAMSPLPSALGPVPLPPLPVPVSPPPAIPASGSVGLPPAPLPPPPVANPLPGGLPAGPSIPIPIAVSPSAALPPAALPMVGPSAITPSPPMPPPALPMGATPPGLPVATPVAAPLPALPTPSRPPVMSMVATPGPSGATACGNVSWGEWIPWTDCSDTCGNCGRRERFRRCPVSPQDPCRCKG